MIFREKNCKTIEFIHFNPDSEQICGLFQEKEGVKQQYRIRRVVLIEYGEVE